MKKLGLTILSSAAVICFTLHFCANRAESRPAYAKEFAAKYVSKSEMPTAEEKSLAEAVAKAKCFVCHEVGKEKKDRNDYGKALADILKPKDAKGFKGETDTKKIDEALDKVAAMRIDGKDPKDVKDKDKDKVPTYGDLIKKGKLPVEYKPADEKKAP